MRVHEEVVEAGVGQVLLDSPPHARAGSGGPRLPRAAWTVCAFRQPAADRRAAEETPVLRRSYRELEADAFVAGEERKKAVSGRRADDLEAARRLEGPEGAHEIAAGFVKTPPQAKEAESPEFHQGQQRTIAAAGEGRRRLGARGKALVEERLQLAGEFRAGELVGQHRCDSDGHRSGHRLGGELLQHFEQREVGVDRRFAEPVAPMRPAPVIEDVRQMAVEGKDEVDRRAAHRAGLDRARARLYTSR